MFGDGTEAVLERTGWGLLVRPKSEEGRSEGIAIFALYDDKERFPR